MQNNTIVNNTIVNNNVNNNMCKLPLEYNYLDLRFHSYMFDYHDFVGRDENPNVAFFRNIFNDERYTIEDYTDTSIYDALKRQYEEFVGEWDEACEKAFDRVIIMFTTASR